MSTFKESEHPRGQADNAGQFRVRENSGPVGTLIVDEPPAAETVQWEPGSARMIAPGTNPWIQSSDGHPLDLMSMVRRGDIVTATGTRTCEECEHEPFPGVLTGMDTPEGVQRCDGCQAYDGDCEAASALAAHITATSKFQNLQVWFEADPDPLPPAAPLDVSTGFVRLRSDGRYEVADHEDANREHGCRVDDWCILANGHYGGGESERELWPGPDALFFVSLATQEA